MDLFEFFKEDNLTLHKSFVTERDQCLRRRFDTELKECRSYSPKQVSLM